MSIKDNDSAFTNQWIEPQLNEDEKKILQQVLSDQIPDAAKKAIDKLENTLPPNPLEDEIGTAAYKTLHTIQALHVIDRKTIAAHTVHAAYDQLDDNVIWAAAALTGVSEFDILAAASQEVLTTVKILTLSEALPIASLKKNIR